MSHLTRHKAKDFKKYLPVIRDIIKEKNNIDLEKIVSELKDKNTQKEITSMLYRNGYFCDWYIMIHFENDDFGDEYTFSDKQKNIIEKLGRVKWKEKFVI